MMTMIHTQNADGGYRTPFPSRRIKEKDEHPSKPYAHSILKAVPAKVCFPSLSPRNAFRSRSAVSCDVHRGKAENRRGSSLLLDRVRGVVLLLGLLGLLRGLRRTLQHVRSLQVRLIRMNPVEIVGGRIGVVAMTRGSFEHPGQGGVVGRNGSIVCSRGRAILPATIPPLFLAGNP
jgi:hypothetical protein